MTNLSLERITHKTRFNTWLKETNINNRTNFDNCCYLHNILISKLNSSNIVHNNYDLFLIQFSFFVYTNSSAYLDIT